MHGLPPTSRQSLRSPLAIQGEAQPWEVHIWGNFQEVFGISGHSTGHRGRSQLNICNSKREVTLLCEGSPDAEWTSCNPQSVHQQIHEQMQAILPSLKEEWSWLPLERGMRDNLSRTKEIYDFTSLAVKASSGETLYLYLAISESAISGALVREDEGEPVPSWEDIVQTILVEKCRRIRMVPHQYSWNWPRGHLPQSLHQGGR